MISSFGFVCLKNGELTYELIIELTIGARCLAHQQRRLLTAAEGHSFVENRIDYEVEEEEGLPLSKVATSGLTANRTEQQNQNSGGWRGIRNGSDGLGPI